MKLKGTNKNVLIDFVGSYTRNIKTGVKEAEKTIQGVSAHRL